jgi:protein-tyrosine phosphatase
VIDLHCHILAGLDDGALSLEDSVAMARQAEEEGIAVVCATPHIRPDHNVRIEEIASRVGALQQELADRGVGVSVVPGGELAQTEADRLTDPQLRLVALGGAGGSVLLEPASGPLSPELESVVQRLGDRGLGAVIAHPERHVGVGFQERLERLASAGGLIQWTAEFVANAAPSDPVLRLARDGFVHVLGSDAHSSYAGRPVRLAAGLARLATVCTPAQMAWIVEGAPEALLRGERVNPLPGAAPA